jgi:Outer membrane protein beta-barrel domain
MRRTLHPTFPLLCLVAFSGANAQSVGRSGLGIKAGVQWCTLVAPDLVYSPTPGGIAGVYVPLHAGSRVELQPEVLLSYQGADVHRTDEEAYPLRMLYIHLPVSAKIFLSNDLNLQGGLQAGKCMSAAASDASVTEDVRPYDVGFIAGLGLDLKSGFDLTARYYGGTTPVFTDDNGVNPRHRLLQLTAGYRVMRLSHRKHRLHKG